MKSDMTRFQRILGYQFRNTGLLREALTHRSFASEHNLKYDNQRLEFLGDAVLQISLTIDLYSRYPRYDEGVLTRIRSALVNQDSLADLAHRIELGEALLLGHGENEHGGYDRDSTLSDAFEAVLGAVMLDSDLETARKLAARIVGEAFPNPEELLLDLNPKGTLQEYCQHNFGHPPFYKTTSVEGPAHDPHFTVDVLFDNTLLAEASAAKRKIAEMEAARIALNAIRRGDFEKLQKKERSAGK